MLDKLERACDAIAFWLTKPFIVVVCACLVCGARLMGSLGADPDLFARVAVGRLIQSWGYLPLQDPFAFTPKNPLWVDHEWLSGVVFLALAQAGGDPLLFAFKTVLLFLTIALLVRAATTWSGRPNVIWTIACLMHGLFAWMSTIRCQVFTYLFVAVLLLAYIEYWRNKRVRYLLLFPFLMFVWCNLHGGFIVGLGLMGLGCAATAVLLPARSWALPATMSFLSFLATAFNPYGFSQYWSYILHAITMPRPSIEEWSPVSPFDTNGAPLIIFVLIALIGFGRCLRTENDSKSRRTLFVTALFLAFGFFFGFRHIRLIPLSMCIAVAFGSRLVEAFWETLQEVTPKYSSMAVRMGALTLAIIGLPLFIVTAGFYSRLSHFRFDMTDYPVRLFDDLRGRGLRGNLLVDFNTGSYALWRLYPAMRVSMDGRYEEVYPESTNLLVGQAFKFGMPASNAAIAKIRPDYILVPPFATRKDHWKEIEGHWISLAEADGFRLLGKEPLPPPPRSVSADAAELWSARF